MADHEVPSDYGTPNATIDWIYIIHQIIKSDVMAFHYKIEMIHK